MNAPVLRRSRALAAALVFGACGSLSVVMPARGAYGVTVGGACKAVTTFTSSAVPAMRKDGCTGCHAGASAEATRVFDLTSVGKDDASACAQSLREVNLANKPQSPIIQAATGGQAHKGGKVDDPQAFTSALLAWINDE